METQGILYIATGKKYIHAAIHSAKSVLRFCPDLSTHLFSDWQNYDCFSFDQTPYPFTSVGTIDNPHPRSKVDYLPLTPFDRTLYLDTDTILNADVREIFRLLERFDIALNHAHRRNDPVRLIPWRTDLPRAFPQHNGGVILYRKTPEILQFLSEWRDQFKEAGFLQDQVTLRELLWLSDLRMVTLPPEYNVRYLKYKFLWLKAEAQVKILHLRRYHDGPFWFIKKWIKHLGRAILLGLGIDPGALKKRVLN